MTSCNSLAAAHLQIHTRHCNILFFLVWTNFLGLSLANRRGCKFNLANYGKNWVAGFDCRFWTRFSENHEDMDVEVQGSESPNKNRGPNFQGGNLGGDPHGIESGYASRDHKRSVCHGQPVNEQNGWTHPKHEGWHRERKGSKRFARNPAPPPGHETKLKYSCGQDGRWSGQICRGDWWIRGQTLMVSRMTILWKASAVSLA